jgi:predicted Zn-dependent protease
MEVAMARAVALALVLIVSCGSKPPQMFMGERIPKGCSKEDHSQECTAWWIERVLALLGQRAYEDRAIEAYVTSVGRRLARAAGDHRRWKFRVLDDPGVQAFVTFGSTVYMYRGTLAILRSEAELAAVLAHEMGHVRGGHTKEDWEELGRDIERSDVEKSMEHKYERDDEIQADETAVLLLARAGYDSRAVETMLRALAGTTRYDAVEDPDDVHPWWPERIARAQLVNAGRAVGELGAERYRARVASLIVGSDPRRVSIVAGAVVFARARAVVPLPAHESAKLDDDAVEIVLVGGARVSISMISAEMAQLLDGFAKESKVAIEIHHESGKDAITIMVTGTEHAAELARAMRGAIREPRAAELAGLIPTRVDLDAPRRLWSRVR